MKKNLSTLGFAGLVALAGLVSSGCGSDTTTAANFGPTSSIHEYAIIANNTAGGSFTIKGVNLQNGTSNVLRVRPGAKLKRQAIRAPAHGGYILKYTGPARMSAP